MSTPVIMPKLEMTQETALVVQWLKRAGEQVKKGEALLVVETDKVTVEVESPAEGILAGIRVQPGDTVPVTSVIAEVLEPGSPAVSPQRPLQADPAARALRQPPASPVARRMAAAEQLDLGQIAGSGPAGRITKADVAGALAASAVPAGKVRASPAARRLARARQVPLEGVPGSGPDGRVQAADVLAAPAAGQAPGTPPEALAETAGYEVVPLRGMRQTIAGRVQASYRSIPHITLTVRVEMAEFERAREQLNAWAAAGGGSHVPVTALLVKATAWALRRHRWLNSRWQGAEIHLLSQVNIGVAVALPEGLIVPVVRHADQKGLEQIAGEISDLAQRARQGKLSPGDVAGGTFTISNLGPYGIEHFTAIIHPGQAAILAAGAIQDEVVPVDSQPAIRPILHLALSADHRIVDGSVAAQFLADLKAALEHPALVLW